jgi:hypothetical protein
MDTGRGQHLEAKSGASRSAGGGQPRRAGRHDSAGLWQFDGGRATTAWRAVGGGGADGGARAVEKFSKCNCWG